LTSFSPFDTLSEVNPNKEKAMAKSLVLSAGGKSVVLPIKPLVAVEVSIGVAVLAVGTAIGAVCGSALIGFGVAAGFIAVSEVAEFLIAKAAIKSGKLSIGIKE